MCARLQVAPSPPTHAYTLTLRVGMVGQVDAPPVDGGGWVLVGSTAADRPRTKKISVHAYMHAFMYVSIFARVHACIRACGRAY